MTLVTINRGPLAQHDGDRGDDHQSDNRLHQVDHVVHVHLRILVLIVKIILYAIFGEVASSPQ